MRLSESLRSSEVSSDQQGVLIDEDSCGFVDHVNEYDEKLNTSTIKEEDQRCILIIGGIKTFLPSSQAEASINVVGAATKGQPTETFKEEEEKEKTLMFSPAEGEEHSTELLKIFSQEAEQEMTAALEPATEEEADNMDFVELYEELEALERRVIVQSQHIQQIRLETDGGAYQPGEQLEEVGVEPTQEEMTEANMSEEEVEKQLSDETAELESAAGWQDNATEEENNMGDQDDLPIDKEEECSREDCIRRTNQ
jgi:hypothetical protein